MIRDREVAFWIETGIHEASLLKMSEDRDIAMKVALELRYRDWLNSLEHCKESFRLMTHEKINNRTLMESLTKRHRELTERNAKILDWAMKTVSSKKKVSLPQIRISDCIPYTIVPQDVIGPPIHFSNPNPSEEIPFIPCKAPSQNKTSGTIRRKELTPLEEVEQYLKKEAAKEKSSKTSKCPTPKERE